MDNACVIGYGYVGKATAYAFGIKKYFTRHDANITLEEAAKCKYIFICLPTPTVNGKAFTDDILKVIEQINSYPRTVDSVFIIRSTVWPGFAKHVQEKLGITHVVSNPEFLSEATWQQDARQPQMVVIGCDNDKYIQDVKALYAGRFKYIEPLLTSTTSAELIKLAINAFFSTKVAFFNEIFNYAQKVGANYEAVKTAIYAHPWGTKNHGVIWYKGVRGIHGHCLPKDLEAIAEQSGSKLFKTIISLNETYE